MTYGNKNSTPEDRKRLEELSDPKKFLFDDPVKYKEVYFPEFDSRLKVISAPPEKADQYNCFAYALRLNKWVRAYTFNKAIENKNLIPTTIPKKGDIVVYSDKNIRHAGRYISKNKVRSKWAGGAVFEHDTFMCPAHYGDKVDFYKAVSMKEAEEIFNKYPVLN